MQKYEIQIGDDTIVTDLQDATLEISSKDSRMFQIYRHTSKEIFLRTANGAKIIAEIDNVKQFLKDNDLKSGYKHGSWVTANFTIE